jgi:hypothetical protein
MEQQCAAWISAVFVIIVIALGFFLSPGKGNKRPKE